MGSSSSAGRRPPGGDPRRPEGGGAPASPPGLAGASSGLLLALAFPPYSLWPLAFVGLVPLARACTAPGVERGRAVREGIAFGAVFHLLLLHWVPTTLHGMIPFGGLSGLLLLVLLAGVGGVQGRVLHLLVRERGAAPILALPAVWAGTEFLFEYAGPLAIPWLPLALPLAARPELLAPAELGGAAVVSLWVAAVNGWAVSAQPARSAPPGGSGAPPPPRRSFALRPAVAGLVLLLLPALAGVVRAATLPLRPLPAVVLVQLELPRSTLEDVSLRTEAALSGLDRVRATLPPLTPLAAAPGPPPFLALLPEAPFGGPWDEALEVRVGDYASELGLPVLVGAHREVVTGAEGASARRNSVLRLVPGEGAAHVVHDKLRLVPGVERPGLEPGRPLPPSEVAGVRLGVLICFEVAFGGGVRRFGRDGLDLLVQPSNDGWFRSPLPGGRRAPMAQQQAHLILRAVEGRVGAVRSTVGGGVQTVDPLGRLVELVPPGTEAAVVTRPITSPVRPLALWTGPLGGLGGAGLLILLLLVPRGTWRREGG